MTYRFRFLPNFCSLFIAVLVSAAVIGLWIFATRQMAVTIIITVALIIFFVIYIVAEWQMKKKMSIDLSGFSFQASPIAAASMIAGWSAYPMIKELDEENAILLTATCIFAFHSMIALVESVYPDRKRSRRAHKTPDKLYLTLNLILIQGIVAGIIGYIAASIWS